MRVFWHKSDGPNFGDILTPWLLRKHGIEASWAHPARADMFGAGSVAARIPEGFTGVVWGTGKIKEAQTPHLDTAQVLAVRGPLTWEADVYADPGLLCGLYRPDVEPRYDYGVVSHYIEELPDDGVRIDIRGGVENVIRVAAQCRRIISNSLHALILADSLGIPNRWVYSSKVIGKGFKFRDYAASFGQKIEPDVWRLAPQEQVAEKQQALLAALKGLT